MIMWIFVDSCGPPIDIPHSTHASNGTSEYDITKYTCQPGYNMTSDSDTLFCLDTGMWTGLLPNCSSM